MDRTDIVVVQLIQRVLLDSTILEDVSHVLRGITVPETIHEHFVLLEKHLHLGQVVQDSVTHPQ